MKFPQNWLSAATDIMIDEFERWRISSFVGSAEKRTTLTTRRETIIEMGKKLEGGHEEFIGVVHEGTSTYNIKGELKRKIRICQYKEGGRKVVRAV